MPLTYDPPVTNPSQLIQETTGKVEYTDGLLSKYQCVQQKAPAKQLVNIAKTPVLVITGQASIHATYDQCIVQFLQQAGVKVRFVRLENLGIRGNGHYLFLEKNSDIIAQFVDSWLKGV